MSKLFLYQSICYYFFNVLRFFSIHFYAASNPAISFGGMFDERKSDVYKLIPRKWLPKTNLVKAGRLVNVSKAEMEFPLILKPDVGFKGFLVSKVDNEDQFKTQLPLFEGKDLLVQEYVDYSREFSILIYRFPKQSKIGISSFIEKTYPTVTGDGQSTLARLIDRKENPFLKKDWIKQKFKTKLNHILPKGEILRIDFIGNYSRGAKFHSMNELIDEELQTWAQNVFRNLDGVDFCRLDVKADSINALKAGDFKILELNGAKSEPLHIYDPICSVAEIIRDIHKHWSILGRIVKERIELSYKMPPIGAGLKSLWIAKNIVK